MDYLKLYQSLEELVSRGWLREVFDEESGDLAYSLTPEGEETAIRLLKEKAEAWLFYLKVGLTDSLMCGDMTGALKFVIASTLNVHYGIPVEEAKSLAENLVEDRPNI